MPYQEAFDSRSTNKTKRIGIVRFGMFFILYGAILRSPEALRDVVVSRESNAQCKGANGMQMRFSSPTRSASIGSIDFSFIANGSFVPQYVRDHSKPAISLFLVFKGDLAILSGLRT
eukprot:scaffold33119_cov16-Prasinocladus_malaysianus.AAC.1